MILRYLKFGLPVLFLFGMVIPAEAAAEQITNFAQTASLGRDGALSVTDDIEYDPAGAAPHELDLTVPLSYHDDQGREFRMSFHLSQVQAGGKPVPVTPQLTPLLARVPLPAAAAPTKYSLSYTLQPVILRGQGADVLRLSVTGLGWTMPIARASMRLETPLTPADNLTCFAGSQGTTTGSCSVDQQGNVANVTSYAPLQAGESLSIFTDFPSGSFQSYLEPYEDHAGWPLGWILAGVGLAVLLPLGLALFIWQLRRSRYTKTNETPKDQAERE